jgi:hypothetical protein
METVRTESKTGRRQAWVVAIGVTGSVLACSFPQVSFVDGTSDSGDDAAAAGDLGAAFGSGGPEGAPAPTASSQPVSGAPTGGRGGGAADATTSSDGGASGSGASGSGSDGHGGGGKGSSASGSSGTSSGGRTGSSSSSGTGSSSSGVTGSSSSGGSSSSSSSSGAGSSSSGGSSSSSSSGSSGAGSSSSGGNNCVCPPGESLYATGVDCSKLSVLGLVNAGVACDGNNTQGFTEMNVPCGHTGNFVTCITAVKMALQLVCVQSGPPTQVKQECH